MRWENSYWQRRATAARISRRRLLGAVGVSGLGAAGLAVVGCGDDDDNGGGTTPATGSPAATGGSPAATSGPGNRDGIWRARQATPMATINAWDSLNLSTWGMSIPIYDHLFAVQKDLGEPENFLAESVEVQNPTSFVIKIKPSVFHNKPPINGRAVTAEDLQKTFMGMKTNPKVTSKDPWWTNTLEKVDVIDEKTIKVGLTKPDAWTFTTQKFCSSWTSSILPKEHATTPELMNNDLIGSGMYEFVSHENGANLKTKRNDTYRIKTEPNLAGIQTRLIQEQAAAMAAFSAKEIESYSPQNKLERDQLLQKHGSDIQMLSGLSDEIWTLVTRGDGQWKDPRVGQAFSLALDRKEMVELLALGEGQPTGPVAAGYTAWAMSEKELADTWVKFDPAEAKKRLSATAFDTSKEYTIKYYTGRDVYAQFCEILQSQLKKNLGLNIKLVAEDFATWYNKSLLASNYELIAYPSIAYDSPAGFLGAWDDQVAVNWTKFSNPQTTALIRKMESNYDVASRQQQGKELQKLAWETGSPWIPTYVAKYFVAYQKWVKGLMPPGKGSYPYLVGSTWLEKH